MKKPPLMGGFFMAAICPAPGEVNVSTAAPWFREMKIDSGRGFIKGGEETW